uniref:Rho-GAP domain-containing protein n=1 Tax=Setaria digitata TaxID=48799 RepID=A0A915PG27_9BILA
MFVHLAPTSSASSAHYQNVCGASLSGKEEAIECVRWLRDAGFPQYARLYEEHRFPIDIRSVQRDHEFLDDDSLRALFRRLNALNRCAIMKVENVVLRKHPERFDINPLETDIDDDMTAINYDDDDDQVAISNKWKYQRNSRTWSRIVQDDHTTDAFNGDSSWSPRKQEVSSAEHDEALRISFGYRHNPRRQPDGAPHCSDDIYDNRNQLDPVASVIIARNDRACPTVDSSSASASAAVAVNLQRSQSERLKERARALMKRMDIRSSSRRRRQRDSSVANPALSSTTGVQHLSTPLVTASSSFAKVASSGTGRDLVIGDPVLVSHFSASPRTMRMFPDGLSNILSSQAVTPQMLEQFRRGTTTATDDHTSDGVTFAVLQPSMRQQQQQMLADCGTASQHNSCSPSARIRKRFLGVNNRRMGLVLDPSESSTVIAGDSRHKSLRRNKPRDLSCDPVLIRGMSRHDCKTRIYDRVAQDLCSDNIEYADPKCRPGDLETTSFRDRHSIAVRSERPSSSQPCYANNASFSSLIRSGLQFPSDVLSDSSPNYDELRGHPRKDMERKRDRSLALEQSYPRSKLVVNADGYYEHILSDDVHDTSLELAAFASNLDDSVIGSVTGTGTSGTALSVAAYRAVSPESSSSNTSISNHANRLKTEVDSQGRKRLAYCNGSSSFSAGRGASAQRSHSSLESSGNDDELGTRQHKSGAGERRDSGVGSSLSRSPSGPTTQRQRNSLLFTNVPTMLHIREMKTKHLSPSPLNAFRADYNETFVSDANLPHCMDALSVSEMQQIRKLAFLKLSVMIETYAGSGIRIGVVADNGSGRVSKSWAVHKFIRRMRNNETISSNNKPARTEISTFGLPLAVIQSRSGFALPRFILEMMHFLRIAAPDTVGIFRKSGVRSRITEMRLLCDVAPEAEVFTDGKLDSSQVHDIADLLKQYFRELPEPLMTAKYSETFAKIFIHIPVEMRMEALQHAVLLLPDEHREALQTLLYFLHDIAKHSATNSMTPQNLAVCFAPSLFQLCGSRLNSISPTRRHKTIGAAGLPTEREIRESRAAQECLVQMIEHCTKIFIVPSSPGFERDKGNEYCKGTELDAPFLTELGLSQDGNYKTYLLQKARELLKEHRDRWKGWIVEDTVSGVEISTKKSTDGHPLRNLWDPQIINWRTVAILNAENCDVFQYVINDTPSHPTRDATVVRLWRTDMKELRGGCVLVERSVHSSETQMLGGLPAAVLSSQFLVEPIAGRSRVTYITRTDLRGRSNVWYSKVYGQLVARKLSRLRDSFKQFTRIDDGPETKV